MIAVNATALSSRGFQREICLDIEREIQDKIAELNDGKEFGNLNIDILVTPVPQKRYEEIYANYAQAQASNVPFYPCENASNPRTRA